MIILPAIDIIDGKAVRLYKGDYNEKTIYNDDPCAVARDFESNGAEHIHIVDLDGAKSGKTPNIDTVKRIVENTKLSAEIGGGIRSLDSIEKYISIGVNRVILGTAAVTNENFLREAVKNFGDKIAVGIDIKNGLVAIKGWLETSEYTCDEFCEKIRDIGVKTVICTDISKDGAMKGTNIELYKHLVQNYTMNIIASGGISSIDDIERLKSIGVYGAIIGKAYYTGAINLKEACEKII